MVYGNPLFSKESLKEAASHIGSAVFTLIYDANDLYSQEKAGKELRQAEWILATIIDHIFDYYPYSYFMNDDDRKEYPDYLEWFLNHPDIGVRNAIKFVENNFAELETVTRDELNQHRIPRRDLVKEEHTKKVLVEIQNNIDEIIRLLYGPKKVTDPGKPTANEISMLIRTIKTIQDNYSKMADERQDNDFSLQVFQTNKFFEMYKLPLLKAWEVYHYGSHSDFWKEGDSMFDYMMFEIKAKEMIKDLVDSLSQQSPFSAIERNSAITNGLLKVYRHLLTQNLS
jgi:hypothetical protein